MVTPTRRDGEITSSLLTKAGMACHVCDNLHDLARGIKTGAGAVLLTEEAIAADGIREVLICLEEQPAWSDLPIVVLMKGSITSPAATTVLRDLRNVTLLERPAPTRSVVSAVQTAVRGRERQYQIRDQIDAIHQGQNERQMLLESERAARHELERAGRIKDEFLATLSHELRTPLNAILGWAQIIKMDPRDAETVSEGVSVIDRNVRVQTQLIEDLLDVSRIISGKVRLDVQHMDVASVIDAALESVMPALSAKDIRFEKTIDPSVGSVSGDPGRLQQILWNLLTNAIKFTPAGGTIQVLAHKVQSCLEISVTDSGEGIAPEFLPQLFERFTQADASTTRRHGGLGLGLSIVRSLVEMHGGTVSAQSAGQGQGATFTVRLPLRTARSIDREALRASGSTAGRTLLGDPAKLQGLRILIVDDEQDARELVQRFLVEYGATPAMAASAQEAQSLLPLFKPDIIISDIGMPTEDGFEFMRAVRVQGLNTPAVALTAFARPDDRIRSIQAGYQVHLSKPVEPAELIAVIANLAGRYASTDRS